MTGSDAQERTPGQEREDSWIVYWDNDYWAAEHRTKKGLVAGGLTWQELGVKMLDAEDAWMRAMQDSPR